MTFSRSHTLLTDERQILYTNCCRLIKVQFLGNSLHAEEEEYKMCRDINEENKKQRTTIRAIGNRVAKYPLTLIHMKMPTYKHIYIYMSLRMFSWRA